jgi:anti-anti-sigma factor
MDSILSTAVRSGLATRLTVRNYTGLYQALLKEDPEDVHAGMVKRGKGSGPAEVIVVVVHQRRRLLPHPPRARLRLGRPWPVLVVELPAHLDETNAALVKAELIAAAASRPHVLIVDLSQTKWCDWAGAGALAAVFGRATAAGTQLRLVLTDESVRRVLSLNGLDGVIPVYADVALASAAPPG